jgi:8-oxo-dGTP pyrophosphatase MutT (NUDIX family)|tara:strand:+ start:79 stop:753 length:675 start_codon:yes stop_codon:yes gene_type:complete
MDADVIPRESASLIVIRKNSNSIEILMGKRNSFHKFMPNKIVFPGGKLDEIDVKVSNQVKKLPEFKKLLSSDIQLRNHLAHYFCALREAYEETGVIIGCDNYSFLNDDNNKLRKLSDYPRVGNIKLIARAITPPHSRIRFDNRFFLVNSKYITKYSRVNSNELLDIDWYNLDKAINLDIPPITKRILKLLKINIRISEERNYRNISIPLYYTSKNKKKVKWLQR